MSSALAESSREALRPKPFLKWAGGKRQLLPELRKHLPSKFGRYFEPFVGGGALFFDLRANGWEGKAVLGDANGLLVRAYCGVRDNADAVIARLRRRQYNAEDYATARARMPSAGASRVEVADWFIYMNRSCFNGIWRVNRAGQFNVPFGRYTNPTICDADGLRVAAEALRRTEFCIGDWLKTTKTARAGDLVYFDPPYVPVSNTADFTGYTRDGFTLQDQHRLVKGALDLKKRGVHVILSNADLPLVRGLYEDRRFTLHRVRAVRNINSQAGGRGAVGELIIT